MKTIFKYPIYKIEDEISINLPSGAKILSAQIQREILCIWALIDTDNPLSLRIFRIIGTGHHIDDENKLIYINTFQMNNGKLVFHLFEKIIN